VSTAWVGVFSKALGRDAAGVANDEIDPVAVAIAFERDRPAPVLERVGDQVVERLRDAERINVGQGVAASPLHRNAAARAGSTHSPALARGDRKHPRLNGPAPELGAPTVHLTIEIAKGSKRELERVWAVWVRRLRGKCERLQWSPQFVQSLVEGAPAPAVYDPGARNHERHRDRHRQEGAQRRDERAGHAGSSR
jgi:hypothetical protein